MAIIETEIWKPNPERPGTLVFDSQRSAQDVFDELKAHLSSIGRMPDEYFSLWMDWKDDKPFPKDAMLSCEVKFGGSEGIYLDISIAYEKDVYEHSRETGKLGWHNRTVIERFATGKTLGEANDDLDRMYLAASSVTAAFYSLEDGIHARYVEVKQNEPEKIAETINTEIEIKKSELLDRIEKNLTDYKESLMSFTKLELIEKSDQIHAMNNAHFYMTYWNGLTNEDIDFFLQFQNPLEIVADAWYDYNTYLGDMRNSLDALIERKDKILADYPLVTNNDVPADNSLHRYMNVNLNEFLGKISEKVIIHYPGDFKHDMKILNDVAELKDFYDRRLVWHVCSYGTYMRRESEVFLKDTGDYACMVGNRQNEADMYCYIVEVTGKKGEAILGNVYEAGNYAEYTKYITETAVPYESVTLTYSDEWGINAGRTKTVSKEEYQKDSYSLMFEKGFVTKVDYNPQDKAKHAAILSGERSRRMSYPIGSTKRHLLKLIENLVEIRNETTNKNARLSAGKPSISDRLKKGAEKAQEYKTQIQNDTSVRNNKDLIIV